MKRLMFIAILILGLCLVSCEKEFNKGVDRPINGGDVNTGGNNADDKENEEIYWADNAAYNIYFALCDESGDNILQTDKDAIYDVEILYEGVKYRFEGEVATRATCTYPLAIRLNPYVSDWFGFGDFIVGSHSSFTITFRDSSWEIEQESRLNPEDINGDIILDVKIDGEEQRQGIYTLFVK
jgi:hypothetical protein